MSTESHLDAVSDDELAEALAARFGANELRSWMSENGLKRERGANKMTSARLAIEQDREGIGQMLIEANALDVEVTRQCDNHAVCGNETAGPNNATCDECVDAKRQNTRADDPIQWGDYDNGEDFWAALHERYVD